MANMGLFAEHYKYPDPYGTSGITKTRIEVLNLEHPHICPHCHGNNARLQKEANDLYCFICGWREAEYFNEGLNEFIRALVQFTPSITEKDLYLKNQKAKYYQNHKAEILAHHKEQNKTQKHKERSRKYYLCYKETHREAIKRRGQEHYKRNKDEILARRVIGSGTIQT